MCLVQAEANPLNFNKFPTRSQNNAIYMIIYLSSNFHTFDLVILFVMLNKSQTFLLGYKFDVENRLTWSQG